MLIEKKVYGKVNGGTIEDIRACLEKWCQNKRYETFEVVVVLYELYNNAVKYSDGVINIIIKLYKHSIVIRVNDQGLGFDAKEKLAVTCCDLKRSIDQPSGRGIYIIKKFVDRICYNAVGNNVVVKIRENK